LANSVPLATKGVLFREAAKTEAWLAANRSETISLLLSDWRALSLNSSTVRREPAGLSSGCAEFTDEAVCNTLPPHC